LKVELTQHLRGRPQKTFAVKGRVGCLVRTFFRQGRRGVSSDADVRTWRKNLKYMVCPHGTKEEEVEPVRTFFGHGRVVNFVRTSFMDGP